MNTQLTLFAPKRSPDLATELNGFAEFSEKTQTEMVDGVPYFINEFWTARQRQADRIHEVSYRACFKPQLPAFFIERLSERGDVVYDPFMGRGTTPIEATLLERIPYGNDVNPLSQAFVEPRINPPSLGAVQTRLQEIPWGKFRKFDHQELLAFYHPKTLTQIEGLRLWLLHRQSEKMLDQTDRWIRMVALNRLTGHSPGFFSVYTLPPNQAVSAQRQKKINASRGQVPPPRDVPALIYKKSRQLLLGRVPKASHTLFMTARSHQTKEIPEGSVVLTVTSPPFLDIVNYEADNWLRCWFLGIDPSHIKISQHRALEDWQAFIKDTLKELSRVTRAGGHIAFEVGEVRNGKIRLEEHVIASAEGLPFETIGVMINRQKFTKTSNCWGISNNKAGTNSNRIVVFRKQ